MELCKTCNINEAECWHHILPKVMGGTDLTTNIIHICSSCHSKIHGTDFTHHRELIKAGVRKAIESGVKWGLPKGHTLNTGRRKKYDKEFVDRILKLKETGLSTYKITAAVGTNQAMVMRILKRYKDTGKHAEM